MDSLKSYWSRRYNEARTGWDLGEPSRPLQNYFDQLEDKQLKILIPAAGNAYEAEYLFSKGYTQVYVIDIAPEPLAAFSNRNPDFPSDQLLEEDFFMHQGKYDLIIEQTFFCSFPPKKATRQHYAKKMHELLEPKGKLVGLWFDIPLTGDMEKRPFGGTKEAYLSYFSPLFQIRTLERCYNSVESRADQELFGIFERK